MTETYTVKQAAEVLGVGTALVYKLIKEDKIPILDLGGPIRIPKQKLHEWINK